MFYNKILLYKKLSLGLVRFNALHQIKSYDPQLVKFTVSSFDFRFCNITRQVGNLRVSFRPNLLCLVNKYILYKIYYKLKKKYILTKKCLYSYPLEKKILFFSKLKVLKLIDSHRSGCGLLGLRIPFDPHTLALQSQYAMI